MLSIEQLKSHFNLEEVSDAQLLSVLPGARSMLRHKLGVPTYNLYEAMQLNSEVFEELVLAEIYYAGSLLPTGLLKIKNDGVLVQSSTFGQGQETFSYWGEISQLKSHLVRQGDLLVESCLALLKAQPKGISCRVL